jgi:beta-galactosidase
VSGGGFLTDRRDMLAITAGVALLPLIPEGAAAASPLRAGTLPEGALRIGRDQPFNHGWRFLRGAGDGLENPSLPDGDWRSVDLPHDWSIEDLPGAPGPHQAGPFTRDSKGGTATGFTIGGEGWYRKHFRVDSLPADARVEVLFDGVYLDSDLWLNGQKLGGNVHGYMPFAFDLTPHLVRGGENVLAVRVRNIGRNSRWYSGSGLYRQVRLDVLPAGARIARWGVGAWTRRLDGGRADIDVTTRIKAADPALRLVTRLCDAKGTVVAEAASPTSGEIGQSLSVKTPRLWSPDSPYLYTIETELLRGEVVIDRMTQPFGIRIVTMDARAGLAINGAATKLRGGCIHHSNGLLGSAAFADADERRIATLKAHGYNAIRSAHNPASRTLREACDRLGMLMIEEAFDAWHVAKEPQDFSVDFKDHWHEVIRAMVLSARNSPSVILWSIGNEIPYRSTPEGVEWQWKLANAVREIDPTRPVTAGLNGVLGAPLIAAEGTARLGRAGKVDNASTLFLDVPGYNYRLEDIEAEHGEHPERVVYASETFPHDVYDYWALASRAPYFMGEFVWTAMDYLGEAGIGASAHLKAGVPYYLAGYPWVNAWCGDIDLIGYQKAPSLARDVVWGLSALEMTVQRPVPAGQYEFIAGWGWSDELASWSWAGVEGQRLAVRVYSSAERIELRLNGQLVGTKDLTAADKMKAEFRVPYAPGTLEAIAYKDGKAIGRRQLETVSAPTRLRMTAERPVGRADRQALHYVAIDILDARGRIIPEEARKIALTVEGPAELIGFGSANPQAVGSFQAHEAQSFRGRAMAILRSGGRPGSVRVAAQCEGLRGASTTLRLV